MINWSDVNETMGTVKLQAAGAMNSLNFGGGDMSTIHFADSHLVDFVDAASRPASRHRLTPKRKTIYRFVRGIWWTGSRVLASESSSIL